MADHAASLPPFTVGAVDLAAARQGAKGADATRFWLYVSKA